MTTFTLTGGYEFKPEHPTYQELEAEVERLKAELQSMLESAAVLARTSASHRAEIERLRGWQPHEDPRRTAYVVKLEAEVERLRADLVYEQERNQNNVNSYSAEVSRLEALNDVAERKLGELRDLLALASAPSRRRC